MGWKARGSYSSVTSSENSKTIDIILKRVETENNKPESFSEMLGDYWPSYFIATPQSKSKSKSQTGVGIIITKNRYTTPNHTTTPGPS